MLFAVITIITCMLLYMHGVYVSRQVYNTQILNTITFDPGFIKTGDIITTSTNYLHRYEPAYHFLQLFASLYEGTSNHTTICIRRGDRLYGLTATSPEKYYDYLTDQCRCGVILVDLIDYMKSLMPTIFFYSSSKFTTIPESLVNEYLDIVKGQTYPNAYELAAGITVGTNYTESGALQCAQNASAFLKHCGVISDDVSKFTMRDIRKLLETEKIFEPRARLKIV